jgi:hypothetical protein
VSRVPPAAALAGPKCANCPLRRGRRTCHPLGTWRAIGGAVAWWVLLLAWITVAVVIVLKAQQAAVSSSVADSTNGISFLLGPLALIPIVIARWRRWSVRGAALVLSLTFICLMFAIWTTADLVSTIILRDSGRQVEAVVAGVSNYTYARGGTTHEYSLIMPDGPAIDGVLDKSGADTLPVGQEIPVLVDPQDRVPPTRVQDVRVGHSALLMALPLGALTLGVAVPAVLAEQRRRRCGTDRRISLAT